VNAGTYTLTATYNGDANHTGSSSNPLAFTIAQASSTTTVTASNVTYDGNPHGAMAVATGVVGLSQNLTVTYVGINGTVYAASTTAPTNAGQYEASASYAGDTNHTNRSGNADFTISPATISYTIGNDSHAYGSTANLAADLPATFNTGINGQNLSLAYSSLGNTTTTHVGTSPITGVVSDGTGGSAGQATDYTVNLTSGTLTVSAENTSIAVVAASVQYSDPVTLSATINTAALGGQTLAGTVAFYINNSATAAASANVSLSSGTSVTVSATTGQIFLVPGTYSVKAVFTSTNGNFNGSTNTVANQALELAVNQEDAQVIPTFPLFVSTASTTSYSATVTLNARQ